MVRCILFGYIFSNPTWFFTDLSQSSIMAMPADYDGMRTDEGSERANSVDDYKVTCVAFIEDISHDYLAWVDRYQLPPDEDKKRRERIAAVITKSNEWIGKVAQTIKGVDVAMNERKKKMA